MDHSRTLHVAPQAKEKILKYFWKEISKNYKKIYPDNKKILSYC